MIINCDTCGQTYRINPDLLKDDQAVITCETCSNEIIVKRPEGGDASDDPFEMLGNLSQSPASDASSDQMDLSEDPFDVLENSSPMPSTDQAGSSDSAPPVSSNVASTEAKKPKKPAPQAAAPETTAPTTGGRSGLRTRLALLMILVILVPLVVFAVSAYQFTSARLARLHARVAEIDSRATADLAYQGATDLSYQVDGWMDKNFRMLKAISNRQDILFLKWRKKAPLFNAVIKEYPWIRQIVTLDRDKNNVGDVGNPAQIDYASCACVNAVINGKPAAWNTLIDEKSGKPVLAMAVRITAGHNETEGVLAGLMNLDDLSNQIARWKSGNNGFAFLVDEAGNRILYAGATDPMGQKPNPSDLPLIKAFHKGKIGAIHFSDSHGVPSVGQVIRTASGWVVATQIPEKESPADLNPAKNAYARLLGAALALGLLMALLAAWLFTRPISELVRTADRISMGELTLEATTNRKDELGDLAEAITRMKESIRISMERLRRRRKSS